MDFFGGRCDKSGRDLERESFLCLGVLGVFVLLKSQTERRCSHSGTAIYSIKILKKLRHEIRKSPLTIAIPRGPPRAVVGIPVKPMDQVADKMEVGLLPQKFVGEIANNLHGPVEEGGALFIQTGKVLLLFRIWGRFVPVIIPFLPDGGRLTAGREAVGVAAFGHFHNFLGQGEEERKYKFLNWISN